MKKLLLPLFLLLLGSLSYSQEIKLMTYNIRYENTTDGDNVWPNRRDYVLSQVNYYEPDIFGTQEGLESQLKWLDENLTDFSYVGVGRDVENGKNTGEHAAIFYNTKKYRLIENHTFWLSENPTVPGKAWDAALSRICTYALFENIKTKKQFYVFNTHFDHIGEVAREKSAELILSKVREINKKDYPFFVMGDFNSSPGQAPVKKLSAELNDSRVVSKTKPFGPEETFCTFDINKKPEARIDFIFTGKKNIAVNKYAVIVDVWNNRYPSDHYPVLVNAEFTK
jgi:endonuclease/exonuclease/phosphatase family metal-dependent hydrolase